MSDAPGNPRPGPAPEPAPEAAAPAERHGGPDAAAPAPPEADVRPAPPEADVRPAPPEADVRPAPPEADVRPAPPPGTSPADVSDAEAERRIRRLSRRSFLSGAAGVGAAYMGWRWLVSRSDAEGIAWPFRRAHELNESLSRDYFRGTRLSPTFDRARAQEPRVNGEEGLSDDLDPAAWRLRVRGLADPMQETEPPEDGESGGPAAVFTLAAVKELPRVEMVTELKCIEGWSTVVRWAGARLADFIAAHPPATRSGDAPDVKGKPEDLVGYVSLVTPDGGYYVGLDMASALHPQTLLCYEMNGEPLSPEHGAPLRLVIPVKYGIKSIKRIGAIEFTDKRPADYWAERGYDWYAGH